MGLLAFGSTSSAGMDGGADGEDEDDRSWEYRPTPIEENQITSMKTSDMIATG